MSDGFLAMIAFPLIIGIWIMVRGLIKVIISLTLKPRLNGWRVVLVIGILSVLFGALLITDPFGSKQSVTIAFAVFAIVIGILYIFDSFRFRRMEDTIIAIM